MSESKPALPAPHRLRRLGVTVERESHAGKQSRVFVATLAGSDVAIELTDTRGCRPDNAAAVDAHLLDRTSCADRHPDVVAGVEAHVGSFVSSHRVARANDSG